MYTKCNMCGSGICRQCWNKLLKLNEDEEKDES